MSETNLSYQICSRCVMDTTDPAITFNEQGHCNHCTEFIEKRAHFSYKGAESYLALENLIQQIKVQGKGKEFD